MKNIGCKIGILAVVLGLLLLFCIDASADIVDKVLPGDKDTVLAPIIGEKPENGQIVLKPEPIIASPLTDQQAQNIRKDWNDALGVDVWQPYYMLQDFENMLRNKFRIKLGPFVGRPNFNYHTRAIEYRFVWRF